MGSPGAKSRAWRGLLHGIPVLLKANIDTHDQVATTAGSVSLKDHHAAADAFIVKRLRGAGAIILGKTNLSVWANVCSEGSSSVWSGLGGQAHAFEWVGAVRITPDLSVSIA